MNYVIFVYKVVNNGGHIPGVDRNKREKLSFVSGQYYQFNQ